MIFGTRLSVALFLENPGLSVALWAYLVHTYSSRLGRRLCRLVPRVMSTESNLLRILRISHHFGVQRLAAQ